MQGLLVFGSSGNPENVIILIGVKSADMSGDDVVFVTNWSFERKFTFDCDSPAVRIDCAQIGTNIVFGFRFADVCSPLAVTIHKLSPAEDLAGDADLLKR